jgi:hypothetical protein
LVPLATGTGKLALGGKNMKIVEIYFSLKSPAIITERKTEHGFKSIDDCIPSTTVRGAILASLYYHGLVDKATLERERENPSLICTPAYPLVNGHKAWPSHPFLFKCKACGDFLNLSEESLRKLEDGLPPPIRLSCEQGHACLQPLYPGIYSKNPDMKRKKFYSVCVGINKKRASFEAEMLWEYDAIAAGQQFWTMAISPDDLPMEKIKEFWIGRGISRGFGRCEIKTEKEQDREEEIERTKNAVKNGRIVLYAISPLLSIIGGLCFSYPQEINLAEVGSRYGVQGEGKLTMEAIHGRSTIFDAGWDMAKGEKRPTFWSSAHSGTILVARLSGEICWEALTALRVSGTVEKMGNFAITGINQLTPLRDHEVTK